MYVPKPFTVNTEKTVAFLKVNGFGQLINNTDNKLTTTPIPFLLSEDGSTAQFHLAKANPQWRRLTEAKSLISVTGPHHYVSPSCYLTPGVPTWNYQVANIYGYCSIIHDHNFLASLLTQLTAKYEQNLPAPWQPTFGPEILNAIVGVELKVEAIEGKFKLGQNRSEEDQKRTKTWLMEQGATGLADAMEI